MEEQFIEFLKEQRIKLAFETEIKRVRGVTLAVYLKRYHGRNAMKYIKHAFRFIETPQGRDFWLDINAKWYENLKMVTV